MLVNHTPLGQLSPSEILEAKQRVAVMQEGAGGLILSTGRSVSPGDCQILRLRESQNSKPQPLFG